MSATYFQNDVCDTHLTTDHHRRDYLALATRALSVAVALGCLLWLALAW